MRYCKHCGDHIEFEYGVFTAYCPICNKIMERKKDTISAFKRKARTNQLKAMHDLMCNANDENIYMTWIHLVPDCPSEEDFSDIALDDKLYNECFDLFVKLIAKKGNRF